MQLLFRANAATISVSWRNGNLAEQHFRLYSGIINLFSLNVSAFSACALRTTREVKLFSLGNFSLSLSLSLSLSFGVVTFLTGERGNENAGTLCEE